MKITLVSLWRRCRVGEGVGEEEGVLVSEGSNLQPRSEGNVSEGFDVFQSVIKAHAKSKQSAILRSWLSKNIIVLFYSTIGDMSELSP